MVLILVIAGGAFWYFKDDSKSILNKSVSSLNDSVEIEEGSLRLGQRANIDGFHIKLSKAILSQGDGIFAIPDDDKYF